MTKEEIAYIAGIIDGEGCISLASRCDSSYRYVTPTVQVSNTHLSLLDWLKELFGGTVDVRKDNRPNRKQCNTWRVAGNKARFVIKLILPYLRIKKDQANIAMSIITYSGKLPDQEVSKRLYAVKQIRLLNKKGDLDQRWLI